MMRWLTNCGGGPESRRGGCAARGCQTSPFLQDEMALFPIAEHRWQSGQFSSKSSAQTVLLTAPTSSTLDVLRQTATMLLPVCFVRRWECRRRGLGRNPRTFATENPRRQVAERRGAGSCAGCLRTSPQDNLRSHRFEDGASHVRSAVSDTSSMVSRVPGSRGRSPLGVVSSSRRAVAGALQYPKVSPPWTHGLPVLVGHDP